MSLLTLKREHSLAIRRPNPMWVFTGNERRFLEDLLLPLTTEDGRPFLYGAADCWDERIHIGMTNLRVLAKLDELNPKRAIISLHRETTKLESGFVDFDGNLVDCALVDAERIRQYFDGSYFRAGKLGHVASACVDYDTRKIWTQDSQGIPVKPEISETLKAAFPDFEYNDLQLKQQYDAHSCAFITLYNMECFARGEMPEGNVDVMALRERYAAILDNYELAEGIPSQPNTYYDRPIHKLRYTPV